MQPSIESGHHIWAFKYNWNKKNFWLAPLVQCKECQEACLDILYYNLTHTLPLTLTS